MHRRLQAHPARLTAKNVLVPTTPLAPWLSQPCLPRFEDLGVFGNTPHAAPNHCLINEYKPGEGIMSHEDGAAYAPVVATVTLGACGVLEIYEKDRPDTDLKAAEALEIEGGAIADSRRPRVPRWRILQEERSLLVIRGDAYRDLLHGIAETSIDVCLYPLSDTGEVRDLTHSSNTLNQDEDSKADGSLPGIVNWDLLADTSRYASGSLERGTRVSLTWRDVLKVSSVGQKLFGRR